MSEQLQLWRAALAQYPVKSCGRLDMSTALVVPVKAGRVESDVIRYVYFKDGSECIVVGDLADHVAFRAADYDALREAARLLVEHLRMAGANLGGSCCEERIAAVESVLAVSKQVTGAAGEGGS